MDPQLEIISTCKTRSFSYKFDENLWTVWHFHPEIDILLNLKNCGHYTCGDYLGELKPGTLLMIGPNVAHALHTLEEAENNLENPAMIALQFSEESLGKELLNKTEMNNILQLFEKVGRCFEVIGETRDKVEEMLWQMKDMSELQRFSHLLLLLDLIATAKNEDKQVLVSPNFAPNLNQKSQSRINTVTQFLTANINKQVSLAEAAELVNMSSKSFSRFFKANTGKNFVQYVNELRIGQACRRLIESNDSITEICYDSGFNNLSNFNRRFLEIKKMSPRDFRQEFCKKVGS
ncbi:MAG: AraC family transcriptional regulator [Lentisphaeraceae bacterium]|nr:AraC family transcriptional regulator [Lentisphaeraceae bacterium]